MLRIRTEQRYCVVIVEVFWWRSTHSFLSVVICIPTQLQNDLARSRRVTKKQVDDAKAEWEEAKATYDRLSQGNTGHQARDQLREIEASVHRLQTDRSAERRVGKE